MKTMFMFGHNLRFSLFNMKQYLWCFGHNFSNSIHSPIFRNLCFHSLYGAVQQNFNHKSLKWEKKSSDFLLLIAKMLVKMVENYPHTGKCYKTCTVVTSSLKKKKKFLAWRYINWHILTFQCVIIDILTLRH